ncbi:MAG: hypothetical protein KDD64_15690 [Bdellovibrionales bacterium]|nr:hypothetical protein [Bdellovibrionales bacterium]
MRPSLFIFTVAALALFPSSLFGARMSEKVERSFTFEGSIAIEIMNFLGLPSQRDGVYQLPWASDTSRCRSGSGSDVLCDPLKRMNSVTFTSQKVPTVVLAGIWFDGETGALPDVPKFSFVSPPIESSEIADWKFVIQKYPSLSQEAKHARISPEGGPLIQLSAVTVGTRVQFSLGIDDRRVDVREHALENYQRCLEELRKSGYDSSC